MKDSFYFSSLLVRSLRKNIGIEEPYHLATPIKRWHSEKLAQSRKAILIYFRYSWINTFIVFPLSYFDKNEIKLVLVQGYYKCYGWMDERDLMLILFLLLLLLVVLLTDCKYIFYSFYIFVLHLVHMRQPFKSCLASLGEGLNRCYHSEYVFETNTQC